MKRILLFCLVCHAPLAWSQCAPGIPSAGNPSCIPPNAPGSPYYQQGGQQAPQPKVQWADRWGAIAIDSETGNAGTVTAYPSKSAAENAALNDCAKNGAKNCTLRKVYYNQCAAVAWGTGYNTTASAGSKEDAEANALASCKTAVSDCKIVYSDCSYPERMN